MSKKFTVYLPRLHDAKAFGQSVGQFVQEWITRAKELASAASLTDVQACELSGMRPFLRQVAGLTETTEFASVDATSRRTFADDADEALRLTSKALAQRELNELLDLI